jgi:hypothetical protein
VLEFRLTGPEGNNPLGFLTALGAVLTLDDAGHVARLGWDSISARLDARFDGLATAETEEERRALLIDVLYKKLLRKRGEQAVQAARTRKEMESAQTAVKKKGEEIKRRRIDREAAKEVRRRELHPLQEDLSRKVAAFNTALVESAADPSVALGKNLTEPNARLIDYLTAACKQSRLTDRRWVDLAAAYGVGDPSNPDGHMRASPWALIKGDSRQNFLTSVEELMVQCSAKHLRHALFEPWNPQDEKYSLRLDSADDRRYALMDRNPTAKGNEPRTLWGANRLAFEALRFFPAMPIRGGMGVRAWRAINGEWQENCRVRWPLWRQPIGAASIHSLLGLRDLWLEDPAARDRLDNLGVHAVMESRRIAVGKKHSLTPATPVWISNFHENAAV